MSRCPAELCVVDAVEYAGALPFAKSWLRWRSGRVCLWLGRDARYAQTIQRWGDEQKVVVHRIGAEDPSVVALDCCSRSEAIVLLHPELLLHFEPKITVLCTAGVPRTKWTCFDPTLEDRVDLQLMAIREPLVRALAEGVRE